VVERVSRRACIPQENRQEFPMKASKFDSTAEVHRVDGRLHLLHRVRDENGKLVLTVTGPLKVEFRFEDFCQLLIGACVLALPVALTEEVWNLGEQLSMARTLIIMAVSIFTLTGFIWVLFYGERVGDYKSDFINRVLSAYIVTFLVALFILFLFDQAPLNDLQVTFTRTVVVAFPASFSATVIDFVR
jgi:uncharacterized membrane protein